MWVSTAGTDAHGSAYFAVRLELIQADYGNMIFKVAPVFFSLFWIIVVNGSKTLLLPRISVKRKYKLLNKGENYDGTLKKWVTACNKKTITITMSSRKVTITMSSRKGLNC
jgi:hypothetical protein